MIHSAPHIFTILLAEADPGVRDTLDAALRGDGHRVVVAAGPGQIVEMAHVLAADVVLLDLASPERDGLAALAALREHGERVPVVFLTGEATLQGAREAMRLGAWDYIAKPVEPDFVRCVIEEALESIPEAAGEAACAP